MRCLTAAAFPLSVWLFLFCLGARGAYAAESGEILYKLRCAQCHGKSGQGKSRIKAPSLVSVEMRQMPDVQLKAIIQQRTNGEMEHKSAHTALKKRLRPDQVEALIRHLRTMQGR